jgi:hypothetical protein
VDSLVFFSFPFSRRIRSFAAAAEKLHQISWNVAEWVVAPGIV